ncbi:hypothetical protein BDB01DRAFT_329563 [Pilobolus umbonatus]|nr:hypothetical protein BDB01DRAFT_329563 [Pilobolus umbonatus]
MYKLRKKLGDSPPSSLLRINRHDLDRDSGIVTESEGEVDQHKSQLIFSDDDDMVDPRYGQSSSQYQPNLGLYSSPTHYSTQADQSIRSLKQLLREKDWKKVLKHKSGTVVYMLQKESKSEKIATFRGEIIIEGFTPQSIFYVIGMRKLWDEQFEEGRLIENLNDTTSLTHEVYKSTGSSKAYDLTLVEKIDCEADGEILFGYTSIDYPPLPKTPGRTRTQIKLQGWVLKQLSTSPVTSRLTYVTQEHIKGWIPGLTKKSLARKPLIVSAVNNYLKEKAGRLKPQNKVSMSSASIGISAVLPSTPYNRNMNASSAGYSSNSSNSSSLEIPSSSTSFLSPPSILISNSLNTRPVHINQSNQSIILSNPPPRISSLNPAPIITSQPHTRRITFADEVISRSNSETSSSAYTSSARSSSTYDRSSNKSMSDASTYLSTPLPPTPQDDTLLTVNDDITRDKQQMIPYKHKTMTDTAVAGTKLYPASRHRNARKRSLDLFHEYLSSDLNDWKSMGQKNDTCLYTKADEASALPIMRGELTMYGSWTPEQVCSVVQCFGSRQKWDDRFEDGHVVERFSQKEYLVYVQMKSIFPIQSRDFSLLTSIESNVSTGTVYIVSTSVVDSLIPEEDGYIRGNIFIYGWAFEPIRPNHQGPVMGVKITFISHMHMGGVTPLPTAIIRLLSTEVPACVDRVQTYLELQGCPPYIRRVAGKIVHEGYDVEEQNYSIKYIAKHAPSRQYRNRNSSTTINSMWCTDLRTHLSSYPHGYSIETQPIQGVRVDMRPDGMGFRIYTEKAELDGKTVSIRIKKNNDTATQFLCNTIPLLVDQCVVSADTIHTHTEEKEEARVLIEVPTLHSLNNKQTELDESDELTKSDTLQRRESDVLIISSDLTFTASEFSFIVLLMAICYYLGKFSCHCSL